MFLMRMAQVPCMYILIARNELSKIPHISYQVVPSNAGPPLLQIDRLCVVATANNACLNPGQQASCGTRHQAVTECQEHTQCTVCTQYSKDYGV